VLGTPGLRPYDARRWQHHPHLTVSLAYLRDILAYLYRRHISLYRMASDLAPYLTHPDFPEFHRQVEESLPELAHVGELARTFGIRLTFHAPSHVVLSTPRPEHLQHGVETLTGLTRILDAMGMGSESIIVLHVGGGYEHPARALDRFCAHVEALPPDVRRRLALEHDGTTFDLLDVMRAHERTGLPIVFDLLHHRLLNRQHLPLDEALSLALGTWPAGVRPKVHLASPSTSARRVERRNPVTGKRYTTVHPPLPNQHSDFVHPFDAIALLDAIGDRDVDVMVEARAHDVAVARLHLDILRYAPERASYLDAIDRRGLGEPAVPYAGMTLFEEKEEDERALVVVLNNLRDFDIVRDEGWYRIPVKHAPNRLGASYLAFYLTRVFGPDRWSVPYVAPVRRYRIVRRRDLLPEEPRHPRADAWYYKVELGPLQRLPRPVPSRHFRRVTFIPTTVERLLNARDVTDLWLRDDLQEQLYDALIERRVPAETTSSLAEAPASYQTGLRIPCLDGGIWVTYEQGRAEGVPDDWAFIALTPEELAEHLDEVVDDVLDEVRGRGGVRQESLDPV